MNKDIKAGTLVFKPRARLIKTIGEELISDDKVAIIELVKNSYDAYSSLYNGAPIVDIVFQGNVETCTDTSGSKKYIISKTGSSIIIYDEGVGMDFNTIEHAWMEPATNFKKLKENQDPQKKYSGEKGIGRFASAKLASKLELVTRREGEDEIVVFFDWNMFSNEEDYLDDVKINWQIRPAQEIKTHGTILKLYDLNDDWDESKIMDLRISLSRLLNPIVPTEDFLINLELPSEFSKLSGIVERPETLNRPNYSIRGCITKDGKPQNVIFYSKTVNKEEQLKLEFILNREYSAGPFSFEFKIWNRETDELKALAGEMGSLVRNVKKDLDELCGISIYRDNIRVLPYGNKNNDWVRLDIRRVNNPTLRLSNNQIVGYVSIKLDDNPFLKDQSNREGIVESQAFEDLKEYIKLILNEVEQRRYAERPRNTQTKSIKSLFEAFSLKTISTSIKNENIGQQEVIKLLEQKEKEITDAVVKVQETISRYRRLSTMGQLIEPIIHDGRDLLNKIDLKSNIIIKEANKEQLDVNKIISKANDIQELRKDFALLFKRIEPFGGRKRGRPKTIILEEAIENIFTLNQDELSKLNIECVLPTSEHKVSIDESELGSIFMNLIQNSMYWLEQINAERKIVVDILEAKDELSVIFSDNGPGVQPGIEDKIFDPYFSTKPDGIGLGLAIIGETMEEYDGHLSLVDSLLGGASFKLSFKYRI